MVNPLLSLSNFIIDHISESDGRRLPPVPGGAGLYAAIAMRMWWPKVALIAGVGADFKQASNDINGRYDLDNRGPVICGDHCIESLLTYLPDGSRTECPIWGKHHFASMDIAADRISPSLLPAMGTYIFRDNSKRHWTEIIRRHDQLGYILWEVDSAFAQSGSKEEFSLLCQYVDAVSLNLAEAISLFGPYPPAILMRQIIEHGPDVIALRMGGEGALLWHMGTLHHIYPSQHPVADVTGGGNAFSGGLLAGLCLHPDDPIKAGRYGGVAAAYAIAQRGPPPVIHPDLIHRLMESICVDQQDI